MAVLVTEVFLKPKIFYFLFLMADLFTGGGSNLNNPPPIHWQLG